MSEDVIFYPALQQGTPEWLEHRAKFLNASDAPAMMGASPNRTRLDFLTQMSTGVQQEHSTYVEEVVFPAGHEAEARCRMLAEEVMGTMLAPAVATRGRLGASFDGLTMLGDEWWEHKSLNAELRACMVPGATGRDLPLGYRIQLEQEAMVLGAKRGLFSASAWSPAGELIDHRWVWYDSDPELAARIGAGWDQAILDAANHTPVVEPVKAVAEPLMGLPVVSIRVEGKVSIVTKLDEFGILLGEYIAKIPKSPSTDSEFATCKLAVKELEKAEKALRLAEEMALAQFTEIDAMRRSVDLHANTSRTCRLATDKLVAAREHALRAEIVIEHQDLLNDHVKSLNDTSGRNWIPRQVADFAGAMKSLRTFTSMREACGKLLLDRKLALNEQQNLMTRNWAALSDQTTLEDWTFLFADFAQVGQKPTEDFKAIAGARIAAHKDALEKKRLQEEERKKREADEAEARRVASEKAAAAVVPAPVPAPAAAVTPVQASLLRAPPPPVPADLPASMRAPADLPPPRATEQPTLKLGDICALFGPGFTMTADFLRDTLKVHHRNTAGVGKLYYPSDLQRIGTALLKHIQAKLDEQSPF